MRPSEDPTSSERSATNAGHRIRPINPDSATEVALVVTWMRQTLMEVIGEERGQALYTLAWLEQRVRWHLDPTQCTAQIFLAETVAGGIVGHTIVRVDADETGQPIGLFSTTYVVPAGRRSGVADSLLRRGEGWMREQGMTVAATNTSATNVKLINLYEKHGYTIVLRSGEMVQMAKTL